MKILFITPYPYNESPSQRFRFEQYYKLLSKSNHIYKYLSFLNHRGWRLIYADGPAIVKAFYILWGFFRRIIHITYVPFYDIIFIHREAAPIGPPLFEWFVARILRSKIIYDFDDAVWLTDRLFESKVEKFLRFRSKVSLICQWSCKVSCGNSFLAGYARQFCKNVIINPTTIDTGNYHNLNLYDKVALRRKSDISGVVIGWTGSHSTLKYLDQIHAILQTIEAQNPNVYFLVIADRPPNFQLKRLVFKKWSIETEISDLLLLDIGIMPLPDDNWTRGKCGFKILQYMALSIPCVASDVGVNSEIIQPGINGYLSRSNNDWLEALGTLIYDAELRRQIGQNGRATVANNYSTSSNSENFLALFE